jgi:hypothetical protein
MTTPSEVPRDALDAIRQLCDQHHRGRPEIEIDALCRKLGRGASASEAVLDELVQAGRMRVERTKYGLTIEMMEVP